MPSSPAPGPADPALRARQLTVERGGHLALEGLDLDVAPGEVFALLGGNGAGKTTTLLTFLGFCAPQGGEAWVKGVSVADDPDAVRRLAAYLPETASLYPHLDAYENLRYFLAIAGVKPSAQTIDTALDRVRLDAAARSRRLDGYSKGMRQKVAIALAILRETPVLLLDEPTSGLDPVAIDEFNALIGQLSAGGTTVFMVTHDVYGACQVAKRIGLLQKGQLVGTFRATDEEAISVDAVHEAFAAGAAS
ncbi:MAG: ABC transporter ATP-binding protein [Pseudomonadota bacterium]